MQGGQRWLEKFWSWHRRHDGVIAGGGTGGVTEDFAFSGEGLLKRCGEVGGEGVLDGFGTIGVGCDFVFGFTGYGSLAMLLRIKPWWASGKVSR